MDDATLAKMRRQSGGQKVAVLAVDLETGQEELRFTDNYVLVTTQPYRLAHTQEFGSSGTVQLTIKRLPLEGFKAFDEAIPTQEDDMAEDEFICERCTEICDDPSYQPLCPDCYHETEGQYDNA